MLRYTLSYIKWFSKLTVVMEICYLQPLPLVTLHYRNCSLQSDPVTQLVKKCARISWLRYLIFNYSFSRPQTDVSDSSHSTRFWGYIKRTVASRWAFHIIFPSSYSKTFAKLGRTEYYSSVDALKFVLQPMWIKWGWQLRSPENSKILSTEHQIINQSVYSVQYGKWTRTISLILYGGSVKLKY